MTEEPVISNNSISDDDLIIGISDLEVGDTINPRTLEAYSRLIHDLTKMVIEETKQRRRRKMLGVIFIIQIVLILVKTFGWQDISWLVVFVPAIVTVVGGLAALGFEKLKVSIKKK